MCLILSTKFLSFGCATFAFLHSLFVTWIGMENRTEQKLSLAEFSIRILSRFLFHRAKGEGERLGGFMNSFFGAEPASEQENLITFSGLVFHPQPSESSN
jgi:hypothetical protein